MNEIEQFLDGIINGSGGFKVWGDREFVAHKDRDMAIAEWVIRCLANTENELSQAVLNAIKERREAT